MLKRVADSGSPCLTPVCTSNLSVNSLFIFTIAFAPVSVSSMSFCSFPGILFGDWAAVTYYGAKEVRGV